eukprot:COSAG01_NODE_4042_length_5409_cov_25.792844_2_plen_238_part_00
MWRVSAVPKSRSQLPSSKAEQNRGPPADEHCQAPRGSGLPGRHAANMRTSLLQQGRLELPAAGCSRYRRCLPDDSCGKACTCRYHARLYVDRRRAGERDQWRVRVGYHSDRGRGRGCRCSTCCSTCCVVGLLSGVAILVLAVHLQLMHARCGRWTLGCARGSQPLRCYGGVAEEHTVLPGDNCSAIAAYYGVPLYDVLDVQSRRSCCQPPHAINISGAPTPPRPPPPPTPSTRPLSE